MNGQQNQRFRNAFAEHGGKLARLAMDRRGPTLILIQIEGGIVFSEHHACHREVAVQIVRRHRTRDGVQQVHAFLVICPRQPRSAMTLTWAHQHAAVLAAVKDKPFGRPQAGPSLTAAARDGRTIVRAGTKEWLRRGAEQKNDLQQEDRCRQSLVP